MKKCSKCHQTKPLEDFHPRADRAGKIRSRCKPCWRLDSIEAAPRHRQRNRRSLLKARYGITIEQYDAMLISQGGCCAICRTSSVIRKNDKNFHVDHDHVTGKVRGLLCVRCNLGIGCFGDGRGTLLIDAAAAYVREHS